MKTQRALIALIPLLLATTGANALEPLGNKTGFSGFVNIGVGGGSIESNFLAKVADVDVDLGRDTIQDLGSPRSKDVVLPALTLELGYTFANGKTRVSVGNDFADYLQFDRSTLFAIRHDFDGLGRFQLAYLQAAGMATEVWSDPYLVGASRQSTDLDVSGVRLTWDRMFGSAFELKVSAKERDLENERSGASQPLTAAQRQLLDRNGDINEVELGYLLELGGGHALRPSIRYTDWDLDGRAMAQEGLVGEVTYLYQSKSGYRWVTTGAYGKMDGDAVNPLFGKKNDANRYFIASTLFLGDSFGLENWTPNITVLWGQQDTDITFNEVNMWLVTAQLLRRF